jgi:ADP-ribose pyrophosphatase
VEIVAGRVEDGEDVSQAARRECREEIGVEPGRLIPLLQFIPAPGVNHEIATLFLGLVDGTQVPARTGAVDESEEIVPFRVPIDEALRALTAGSFVNGYTTIALQWLALNRQRLADIAGNVPAS